jgi:hypothetical protein
VASCLQYVQMITNAADGSALACKHSWDCTRALRVAVWRAWVSSRRQIWACNTLASRAPTSFNASGLRARFFSSEANKRAVWKYAMRMACVAVVLQPTHRQPLQLPKLFRIQKCHIKEKISQCTGKLNNLRTRKRRFYIGEIGASWEAKEHARSMQRRLPECTPAAVCAQNQPRHRISSGWPICRAADVSKAMLSGS